MKTFTTALSAIGIILLLLAVSAFRFQKTTIKQSNKVVFSYVSYEYGKPLQKNSEDFAVRRIYEVYDNKELKVIDKIYKGYEITTDIKLDNKLFKTISALKNINSFRTKIKLEEGKYYAGAYDYIAVWNRNSKEELCFITPLVSDKLVKLINSFYDIKLKTGTQETLTETPAEVGLYKVSIIPIHKESYLPQITLPPPSL